MALRFDFFVSVRNAGFACPALSHSYHGCAFLIVRVRVALPIPLLLVALRVTVEVPDAVGVPVINPVVLFIVNPLGSPVAP